MYTNQSGQRMPDTLTIGGVLASREFHIANIPAAQLAAFGWRRLVREEGCAPFGYLPLEAQEAEGEPIWYAALAGTVAERAEACLESQRKAMTVTRLQARLALIQSGLWDVVTAAMTNGTPQQRAFFEDAQTWQRLDPTLVTMMAALGISEEQGDELFQLAATL